MASSTKQQIKEAAEADFFFFCELVNPGYMYGDIHREVANLMGDEQASEDQLFLLPRGHLKSHLMACWAAWHITKHPYSTILYVSATESLAILQLSAIKGILESDTYRRYWPEMVKSEEHKRAQWAMKDIKVDHPERKRYGVRDATVAARGITANTTGMHCDVLLFDDIVVPANAYTEEGRNTVAAGYSQLSSVLNPGGLTKVVGTRYHGNDIYATMVAAEDEMVDDDGEVIETVKLFEVFERVVEKDGVFLWPRVQSPDNGRWYGFNRQVLAKIRAKYYVANERSQFYAQYYNNPSESGSDRVQADQFQYLDPRCLTYSKADGCWQYMGLNLHITLGGDLAYTTKETSDYTAYAVIGVDQQGFYYILDLVQFKTDRYQKYADEFIKLLRRWEFRKAKIESVAGANVIVKFIQEQVRETGIPCSIVGDTPAKDKAERRAVVLEPLYDAAITFHTPGGLTRIYEEQITLARPAHDDIADAVVNATAIARVPRRTRQRSSNVSELTAHPRFGGIRR